MTYSRWMDSAFLSLRQKWLKVCIIKTLSMIFVVVVVLNEEYCLCLNLLRVNAVVKSLSGSAKSHQINKTESNLVYVESQYHFMSTIKFEGFQQTLWIWSCPLVVLNCIQDLVLPVSFYFTGSDSSFYVLVLKLIDMGLLDVYTGIKTSLLPICYSQSALTFDHCSSLLVQFFLTLSTDSETV